MHCPAPQLLIGFSFRLLRVLDFDHRPELRLVPFAAPDRQPQRRAVRGGRALVIPQHVAHDDAPANLPAVLLHAVERRIEVRPAPAVPAPGFVAGLEREVLALEDALGFRDRLSVALDHYYLALGKLPEDAFQLAQRDVAVRVRHAPRRVDDHDAAPRVASATHREDNVPPPARPPVRAAVAEPVARHLGHPAPQQLPPRPLRLPEAAPPLLEEGPRQFAVGLGGVDPLRARFLPLRLDANRVGVLAFEFGMRENDADAVLDSHVVQHLLCCLRRTRRLAGRRFFSCPLPVSAAAHLSVAVALLAAAA